MSVFALLTQDGTRDAGRTGISFRSKRQFRNDEKRDFFLTGFASDSRPASRPVATVPLMG